MAGVDLDRTGEIALAEIAGEVAKPPESALMLELALKGVGRGTRQRQLSITHKI
jgi:hypothetical protein